MEYLNNIYKFLLSGVVILVMVSFLSVNGFCANLMPNEDRHEKPVYNDDVEVVSTPDTVERPQIQGTQPVGNEQNAVSTDANTTGEGLYNAGYSVSKAAGILSNSYNLLEVKISLIKAGYTKSEVDNAITGIKNPDQEHNVEPVVSKLGGEASGTKNPDQEHNVEPVVSKLGGEASGTKNPDQEHNVEPVVSKLGGEASGTKNPDQEHNVEPVVSKSTAGYNDAISTINSINTRIANGETVSDDEISAAINKLADFLQSDVCNELTDGQQNHLLNKFSNFVNDQLFDSDNNTMGGKDILQTVIGTYTARLDAAPNNTVLSNVILRINGSIGKLWAANNKDAVSGLKNVLTIWVKKNDAKIESLVSEINDYNSSPTSEGAKTVGLKASAALILVYHNKNEVKGADAIMTACADLMKSENFADVTHQSTVFWVAGAVIRRHITVDSSSSSKVVDIVTGKASAGNDASLQLAAAFFGAVKKTMVAGGLEGEGSKRAFNVFHSAFQSMSVCLTCISNTMGSTDAAGRMAEHMFNGVSSETLQSYINIASAKIGDSSTSANAKVSYANGLINLVTYGNIGNADIDVSIGSENFNKVISTAKGLITDKATMLKVRDLRTVNNFIGALSELCNLVLTDQSLTMEQKEEYASTFGDMFKSVLTFQEGSDLVNPSSYEGVKANAQIRFNAVIANLNSKGYENLADKMKESLKGVFKKIVQ